MCSYYNFKFWKIPPIILLLDGIGENEVMFEEMKTAKFIAPTRVNAFSDSRNFTYINRRGEFNYLSDLFK
ncbi:hypothetical protein ACIQZG_01525 [Lysinibacillus sp. NPDC096418]|uniref:hypothetical protein n=1 Tax=Lysinibacillus sp. NPDC096418 TaxID=3364138 RepID=UPI00381EAB6E